MILIVSAKEYSQSLQHSQHSKLLCFIPLSSFSVILSETAPSIYYSYYYQYYQPALSNILSQHSAALCGTLSHTLRQHTTPTFLSDSDTLIHSPGSHDSTLDLAIWYSSTTLTLGHISGSSHSTSTLSHTFWHTLCHTISNHTTLGNGLSHTILSQS